jgi:hypothetical protein
MLIKRYTIEQFFGDVDKEITHGDSKKHYDYYSNDHSWSGVSGVMDEHKKRNGEPFAQKDFNIPIGYTTEKKRNSIGGEFDYERYLDKNECFFIDKTKKVQNKYVTINILCSYGCTVDKERIEKRAIKIAQQIDYIESKGVRCEVNACFPYIFSRSTKHQAVVVGVKDFDSPLNCSMLHTMIQVWALRLWLLCLILNRGKRPKITTQTERDFMEHEKGDNVFFVGSLSSDIVFN